MKKKRQKNLRLGEIESIPVKIQIDNLWSEVVDFDHEVLDIIINNNNNNYNNNIFQYNNAMN